MGPDRQRNLAERVLRSEAEVLRDPAMGECPSCGGTRRGFKGAVYPDQKINELVEENARLRAENDDLRSRITVLSPKEWLHFMEVLNSDPEPSEALRRLMAEVPPWSAV